LKGFPSGMVIAPWGFQPYADSHQRQQARSEQS